MAFAAIFPPATLSVVPGKLVDSRPTQLLALNWSSPEWYDVDVSAVVPSAKVIEISTSAAAGMKVIPMTPPAPNSSFTLQFHGPSVQCSAPNKTQQAAFDYYANALARQYDMTLTQQMFESGNVSWNASDVIYKFALQSPMMLVMSAFAPFEGSRGWFSMQRSAEENNTIGKIPFSLTYIRFLTKSHLSCRSIQ
jgi:hypothetical protein